MKLYRVLSILIVFTLLFSPTASALGKPQASGRYSPDAPEDYPILVCPGTGITGDLAGSRGIRFTVSENFRSVEVRMAASAAGNVSFTAELRQSSGFVSTPIATANVTNVLLPAISAGNPYKPVTINFGTITVSGSQTFSLKFIPAVGGPTLYFETYGIGNQPCGNLDETDENNVASPTVRGDPAGFKVLAASQAMYTITSPYAGTPPEIDGNVGSNEWDISQKIPFENGFVTFKNDGLRLYMLLDVLYDTGNDTGGNPDYFWVTFDTNHNAQIDANVDLNYGTVPGTGNMRYSYYLAPNQWTGVVNETLSSKGRGFGCFFADGSLTFTSISPLRLNCLRHRVWEFGFDLSEINPTGSATVHMGFRAASTTPQFVNEVPPGFGGSFTNLIAVTLSPVLFLAPDPNATIAFDTPGGASPAEVTQAIQNRFNTEPLVQDKKTVARVYVDVNNTAYSQGVKAYLYGSVGGVDLPGSPLLKFYYAPTSINRNVLSNTANIALPSTWDEGTVDFYTKARTLTAKEITSGTFSLTFTPKSAPTYWYLPVNSGTAGSPVLISSAQMDSQRSYLETIYPLARVNWVYKPWTVIAANPPDVIAALNSYYNSVVLAWILSVLFHGSAPYTLPDQIYGFTTSGGGLSDPTWVGAAGRVARGYLGTSLEGTMAHEINHNLDRSSTGTWGRHVNGCGAAGPDPSWPYANYFINEVGFDTRLPWVDTVSRDSVIPSNFPDIMSYCQSGKLPTKWTSPYRWEHQFTNFPTPANQVMIENTAAIQDVFYISGKINRDGTGSLDPTFIQPGEPSLSQQPADASIEIQDSKGTVLTGLTFPVEFLEDPEEPVNTVYFNFRIPYVRGYARIVLKYNGKELNTIQVSANTPSVTGISVTPTSLNTLYSDGGESVTANLLHVAWSASDPDGGTLSFTILYTPDGQNWYPVASNVTGTSYDIDLATIPGGTVAKVRVIVTDGINTSQADSSTFTVPDQVPFVSISAPTMVPTDTPVHLVGNASDAEDTIFPDDAFVWSDNGSSLGTGQVLDVVLPYGNHTITLTVVDSHGNSSQATVQIFVGYKNYLPTIDHR